MPEASVAERRRRQNRRRLAVAGALLLIVALPPAACEDVSVNPLLVAEVRVDPDEVTLAVGETRQFQARVYDAAGRELIGRSVAWGTDSPNVVFVTESGSALGLRPGAARITAVADGASGAAELQVRSTGVRVGR